MTILDKHDAREFLDSENGSILHRVRVERDSLARDIELMSRSDVTNHVLDMIQYSEWQNSSYNKLLHHFIEDHRWAMCARVEALRMLCLRAAKLERLACGKEISRFDYDLVNA